jgi:hypothetical protein
MTPMRLAQTIIKKLVGHINRKDWWHVVPVDAGAYRKRGKFLASTYREAEFWGRPLDEPQKVSIERPLVGDEKTISKVLSIPPQHRDMTLEEIAQHDARWRNAALAKGYDSIVLMSPKSFSEFRATGKLPSSIELNILSVGQEERILNRNEKYARRGEECESQLHDKACLKRTPSPGPSRLK